MKKAFLIPALLLFLGACQKSETAPAPVPSPAPTPAPDTTIILKTGGKVFEKDISNMTWKTVGSASHGYLELTVDAPQVLTRAALDSNIALVYVYTSDFTGWAQVPYHTERNITVTASVTTGKVVLKKQQDDKPSTQSWHNTLRVVLVPAAAVAPLQKQTRP